MGGHTVNAKTRLFAILGDPVTHTMSPVIMNSSFRRLGLDNVFVAMRCDAAHVGVVMEALRAIDLAGYVITMPLKEIVAPYLDELCGEAKISGAVNCIQNDGGRLVGHNTDSKGFWSAIQEKNAGDSGIKVNKLFILGMGGLAKAVATEAAMQGVRTIVAVNRVEEPLFIERFKSFSEKLRGEFRDVTVTLLPWSPDKWIPELADVDVVINVTPIGLESKGRLHAEFPYGSVPQRTIFFDSPIAPRTEFLQEARARGHKVINGLDLVVHQGVYAFKIITGLSVGFEDMRRDAQEFLGVRDA
jgi:shikimate dehydrogenase